eukprot:2966938-Prymnesium_polylepis.2
MHPIRGAWNEGQKKFIAMASELEPLRFLDYIEDAGLVLPPAWRQTLPRCLCIPTRAEAAAKIFNRPDANRSRSWAA